MRWPPCVRNSSYSFIPINFKLCRLFYPISWSVDVHVVLALSSIKCLSLFDFWIYPFLPVYPLRLAYGLEWLELRSWNIICSISMRYVDPYFFVFIFRRGPRGGVIPPPPTHTLFFYFTTDGGYLVCATPHTVLYWSIWNFTDFFCHGM